MKYVYYIFDFDGTLFDTKYGSSLAYKSAFEHFGINFDVDKMPTFLSEALAVSFERECKSAPCTFKEFEKYFYKESDIYITKHAELYPDALDMINVLRASRIKMAIVTNKNRSTVSLILKKFGLDKVFSPIITCEKIVQPKPNPEALYTCMNILNVSNKKNVVYIGDAHNDILAAKAAGIDYIHIDRNAKYTQKDSIKSLMEVIDYSDFLNAQLYPSRILRDEYFSKNRQYNFNNVVKAVCSTRSKFRCGPTVSGSTLADVEKKIKSAYERKAPISFSVPFGAYKGWQINSNDLPDWAEVFNLNYYYQYAQEIANYYEYGVTIYYTYQGLLMSHISNRKSTVNTAYSEVFSQLLKKFSKLNKRITFKLVDIANLYDDVEQYFGEFLDNLFVKVVEVVTNLYGDSEAKTSYKHYIDQLCNDQHEQAFQEVQSSSSSIYSKLQSGYNNYAISGGNAREDLTSKSKEDQIIRSLVSAIMIDAVDSLKKRRQFNKFADQIQLVFDKKPALSLFVGANQHSIKHFWTGTGVLLQRDEDYIATILSQKEWVDISSGKPVRLSGDRVAKKYALSKLDVTTDISNLCDNYKTIYLLVPISVEEN